MSTRTWVRRTGIALAGVVMATTAITSAAQAAPGQGPLRTLIDSGVITRDQAHDFKDEVEAVKAASEGIACSEARTTALASLVSRGVVSQAQADAISAAKAAEKATKAANKPRPEGAAS